MNYSVGTLGDYSGSRLTCSINTAYNVFDKTFDKISFPSFEKAIEALKNDEITTCIVPVSYPRIHTFITDCKLQISKMFFDPIPNLVLVNAKQDIELEDIKTIFLHPATEHLIPSYLKDRKIVYANSNAEACEMLVENLSTALAITNQLSSSHYELNIIKVLAREVNMPWIAFKKVGA